MPKKLWILFIVALSFDLLLLTGVRIRNIIIVDLNPFLGGILLLVSILLAIVSAIVLRRRLFRRYQDNLSWGPADLFLLGFLIFLIGSFFSAFFNGRSTLDIQLHDTYFVIAHAHVTVSMALICLFFAGVYYFFPRISGRSLNVHGIGYLHFALTFGAALAIVVPLQFEGGAGMPRRYLDYSSYYSFQEFGIFNSFQASMLFLLVLAQVVFLVNLIFSLIRKSPGR